MNRHAARRWFPLAALISLAAVALIFAFRPVTRTIEVSEEMTFQVPEAYARVRTILVRKDATRAILEHKGMRLIDVKLRGVKLDASSDDRPLLNALLGNSQSALDAEKLITVEVNDPYASTDRLELVQRASVNPDRMHVDTRSTGRRGNILHYETQLQANPAGSETSMKLGLAMGLSIRVPWVFSWRAPLDAQLSAKQQLESQREALLALVSKNAGEAIIVPELSHQESESGLDRLFVDR